MNWVEAAKIGILVHELAVKYKDLIPKELLNILDEGIVKRSADVFAYALYQVLRIVHKNNLWNDEIVEKIVELAHHAI